MGVVQPTNYLYLAVSCGFLVNKKKELKVGAYEGTLIDIREKTDEYEGKPVQKIECKMQDNMSDQQAIIQFTEESYFSLGFFARINKIDLSRPFIVGVMPSDKNEKLSFCYLKQEPQKKIEKDPAFPQPEKVNLGTKEVLNWTPSLTEIAKIITDIQSKLKPATPTTSGATAPEPVVGEIKKDDSDLPF